MVDCQGEVKYARRVSAMHWDRIKPVVEDLYISNGRTLKEVLSALQAEYGCTPSAAQLKRQINNWGYLKNRKSGIQQDDSTVATAEMVDTSQIHFLHDDAMDDRNFCSANDGDLCIHVFSSGQPAVTTSPHHSSMMTVSEPSNSATVHPLPSLSVSVDVPDQLLLSWNRVETVASTSRRSASVSNTRKRNLSPRPSSRPANSEAAPLTSEFFDDEGYSSSDRLFACPFNKHDPRRYSERNPFELMYRGCGAAVLRTITSVKQHLKRVHFQKYRHRVRRRQPMPSTQVNLEDQMDGELAYKKSVEPERSEGLDRRQQERIMRKRPKVDTKREWFYLYQVCFPESPLPADPYVPRFGLDDYETLRHLGALVGAMGPTGREEIYKLVKKQEGDATRHSLPTATRRLVEKALYVTEAHSMTDTRDRATNQAASRTCMLTASISYDSNSNANCTGGSSHTTDCSWVAPMARPPDGVPALLDTDLLAWNEPFGCEPFQVGYPPIQELTLPSYPATPPDDSWYSPWMLNSVDLN